MRYFLFDNFLYFFFLTSVEPTRFLLKFNPCVNAVDNVEKNTALHWAILAGNVNAVDLLLEAGASLDIKNVKVRFDFFKLKIFQSSEITRQFLKIQL